MPSTRVEAWHGTRPPTRLVLPEPLEDPAFTLEEGPPFRIAVSVPPGTGWDGYRMEAGQSSPSRAWSFTTRIGDGSAMTLEFPDLGALPGWKAEWDLVPAGPLWVNLTASRSNLPWVHGFGFLHPCGGMVLETAEAGHAWNPPAP
jgi:hypothetical protein